MSKNHDDLCQTIEESDTYVASFLEHLLRTADLMVTKIDLDESTDRATLSVEEDGLRFRMTVEFDSFVEDDEELVTEDVEFPDTRALQSRKDFGYRNIENDPHEQARIREWEEAHYRGY